MIAAAVVVVALMSGGVFARRRYFSAPAATVPTTGTVVVNTDPGGRRVVIDGEAHGATPVTATLKAGPSHNRTVDEGRRAADDDRQCHGQSAALAVHRDAERRQQAQVTAGAHRPAGCEGGRRRTDPRHVARHRARSLRPAATSCAAETISGP
jgi:hypothetical protein